MEARHTRETLRVATGAARAGTATEVPEMPLLVEAKDAPCRTKLEETAAVADAMATEMLFSLSHTHTHTHRLPPALPAAAAKGFVAELLREWLAGGDGV